MIWCDVKYIIMWYDMICDLCDIVVWNHTIWSETISYYVMKTEIKLDKMCYINSHAIRYVMV